MTAPLTPERRPILAAIPNAPGITESGTDDRLPRFSWFDGLRHEHRWIDMTSPTDRYESVVWFVCLCGEYRALSSGDEVTR